MIMLKCYSFSAHDFTREHVNGNGKNLITKSLVDPGGDVDKEHASGKDGWL